MNCAVKLDFREGVRADICERGVAYLIAAARSYQDRRIETDLETLGGSIDPLNDEEIDALVEALGHADIDSP